MFLSKTVFILGAGASKEVGLPVGSELAQIISGKLNIRFEHQMLVPGGDIRLYDLMKRAVGNTAQKTGWMIRDGVLLANSIDDFLDRHASNPHVVLYGKLAIVASILEAERRSSIFTSNARPRDGSFNVAIANTWYSRLLKTMGAGVSLERVDSLFENVSFIDFNYDRCLPHFLIEALQPLYGIDRVRAQKIVASATILHPYGSLGTLPMQGVEGGVLFGDPDEVADLQKIAQQVRLYTEQVEEPDIIDAIKQTVAHADRLVFLGFGYHQQNLKLIAPTEAKATREILGTGFGISADDTVVLQDMLRPFTRNMGLRLNSRTGRDITHYDYIKLKSNLTACGLFDEFARTLMS